ncbi:hypothetical protein P7C70_g2947, partial [Phenoliferia sp. Uapishka_3]
MVDPPQSQVASTLASDIVFPRSFDLTSIGLPTLYSPTLAELALSPFPDEVETWLDNDDYLRDLANLIQPITPIDSLVPVLPENFCPGGSSDMVTDNSECELEEVIIAGNPSVTMTIPQGFVSRLPLWPTGGESGRVYNMTTVASPNNPGPVLVPSESHTSTNETPVTNEILAGLLGTPLTLAANSTLSSICEETSDEDQVVPDIMVMDESDLLDNSNTLVPGLDGTELSNSVVNSTLASSLSPVTETRPTTSELRPLSSLDSGTALTQFARYSDKIKRLGRLTSPHTIDNFNYQTPVTPVDLFAVPPPVTPTSKGKEVDRTPHKFTSGFPPGLGFEKAAADLLMAGKLAHELKSLPVDQPLFNNIARPTASPTLSFDHLLPACEIKSYVGTSALFCEGGILIDSGHIDLIGDFDEEEFEAEEEMEEGEIRGRSEELRGADPQAEDSLVAENPLVVAGLNGNRLQ